VIVEGESRTLGLVSISESDAAEDVQFKLEETLDLLMGAHQANPIADAAMMLLAFISPRTVSIPVLLQQDRIQANALSLFPDREVLSQGALFLITPTGETWSVVVIPGTPGMEFQWGPFFEELESRLVALTHEPIILSLAQHSPSVSEDAAKQQIQQVIEALAATPYMVAYNDQQWELTALELVTMLTPGEDGNVGFLEEPLQTWMRTITDEVNQDSRDARLTIQNGRVTDFVESLEGRIVDEGNLREQLLAGLGGDDSPTIQLVVNISQPTVTTSDVNDLGINEVLGVGTSSYRGSPTNRRINIQNGVDLLNGLLIAPGETFSLLKALSPFTTDNGYVPELVIKGDKIEPEIGGGLCQIGTTTFRATMNSGLPVVKRQNHSLVVFYYNDPINGNPGTDATIYDPAPDYQFTNDTDQYILFQAENVTENQELRFTFWGTSDGRRGSYSAPIVTRWIPVGEDVKVETFDLAPGVEQCQGSHVGADASFTYSVIDATGVNVETLFESHYRPLPRICLVGVEELSPPASLSTEILAPQSTQQ
jgi:vancomycin resistance protein YoaR